jgi:hypothetical protein
MAEAEGNGRGFAIDDDFNRKVTPITVRSGAIALNQGDLGLAESGGFAHFTRRQVLLNCCISWLVRPFQPSQSHRFLSCDKFVSSATISAERCSKPFATTGRECRSRYKNPFHLPPDSTHTHPTANPTTIQ